MASRITLPYVRSIKLKDFEPIYSKSIDWSLKSGTYVILGGNGLGKTTLMQAVAYCLAGGPDEEVEENKALRWSHSYFRGRLSSSHVAKAYIEVEFTLGAESISLRRGFRSSTLLALKFGEKHDVWIDDSGPENLDEKYANWLKHNGGYQKYSDFSFIVHRLLYLTESRRMIAWDVNAQVRLLMLLNQDVLSEQAFRQKRAYLKNLDSKKRHIHVSIGKALSQISKTNIEPSGEHIDTEDAVENKIDESKLPKLVQSLNNISQKRSEAERRLKTSIEDLSKVSGDLDETRTKVENIEAEVISGFLHEAEQEQSLALSKLLTGDICPVCGQRHTGLANLARTYLAHHQCVICGQEETQIVSGDLAALRTDLDAQLRRQQAFEEIVRLARSELEDYRRTETDLQAQVNEIRYNSSVVSLVERNLPKMDVSDWKDLYEQLRQEEADLERQINKLRDELNVEYESFRQRVDVRLQKLDILYSKYATKFLGLQCDLVELPQNELMELKVHVPRFLGFTRETPDSCSEAQRFFLDIAFRLALIEASCENGDVATFLCETPENALDVSYINNVVSMLVGFSKKNNIILTANVQPLGIAEKLMRGIPIRSRARHMVNLIEIGQLSNVQADAIDTLNDIIGRMFNDTP
jgi:hypothetical protein